MKIWTLWKQWDDDGLELLFALDNNTVAENWEAWDAGCKAARDRYGITEVDTREVIITVNAAPIVAAFEPAETIGRITSPARKDA